MTAAMKGKRVALVPLAMGFDLAQGWAAILKREVEGFGGTFETRDPELVDGSRRPGHHRTDLVREQAGRAHRHVAFDLNSYVEAA